MRPKRETVLHIVPAIFGKNGVIGGAERYAFELARHMADYVETTLVAFGSEPSESRVGRLRVRVMPASWRVRGEAANPMSLKVLPEILKADVVHCHQQHVVASSSAALTCRLTGRKVFVSDLGGGGWDISRYISTDGWFHKHLHISSYSRKYYGHEGKPWAHVIYGGVDIEKFKPDSNVARQNTVVFVGRLLAHKGVDQIIEALPAGMKLELIGQPYDEVFLNRLRMLADGKDVVFRHNASDDDIVNAYRRALCVVLPSVYRTCLGTTTRVPELLGQTLLEGMACETPAICTDVASMPEIVKDGETGFVVPPNDPETLANRLIWLRDHCEERKAMGIAARQAVMERFQWPTVVEKCLALYRA